MNEPRTLRDGGRIYGARGTLGLIVPSVNTVIEPEFRSLFPLDVALHATRIRNRESTVDDLARMNAEVDRAADELGSARVDLIAYACTVGSFMGGSAGEQYLVERIRTVSGAAVVTAAEAVIRAAAALRIRQISLFTPYAEEEHALAAAFLKAAGIEVTEDACLGIEDAYAIGQLGSDSIAAAIGKQLTGASDGLFISCTNVRTFEILSLLEERLGVPVFSSNSATAWACLRDIGIEEGFDGHGRLLCL